MPLELSCAIMAVLYEHPHIIPYLISRSESNDLICIDVDDRRRCYRISVQDDGTYMVNSVSGVLIDHIDAINPDFNPETIALKLIEDACQANYMRNRLIPFEH